MFVHCEEVYLHIGSTFFNYQKVLNANNKKNSFDNFNDVAH